MTEYKCKINNTPHTRSCIHNKRWRDTVEGWLDRIKHKEARILAGGPGLYYINP